MKTLDVNRNGQINIVEYAARAKEFVKKRILLTFLLQLKARGINLSPKYKYIDPLNVVIYQTVL